MQRRSFLAGLPLVALAAGCGAPSSDPTTLRYYHNKNEWGPYYDELAAKGRAATGLTLRATNIPQSDNFTALIKTSTLTRQKPDLFSWSVGPELSQLVENDSLADVSAIWDQAVGAGDLDPGLRDVFTVGGRQWGIPQTSSYWVMFYRNDVFDDLGVGVPKTWDEMTQVAEMAKSRDIVGFQQPGGQFAFVWFQILIGANDPELYQGLVDGSVPFTDRRLADVMRQWKAMIDNGWMSDSLASTTNVNQLANRRVAMMPGGTFFAGDLAVEGLDRKDWSIFTIPARNPDLEKPVLFFEVGPVVASSDLDNEDAVRRYLRWWTTPEAQQVWADNLGDTSPNPRVKLADPEYEELVRNTSDYQLLQRYYESVPSEVLSATLTGLEGFMVNPASYPDVLQRIEDVNSAYWKKQRRSGGR